MLIGRNTKSLLAKTKNSYWQNHKILIGRNAKFLLAETQHAYWQKRKLLIGRNKKNPYWQKNTTCLLAETQNETQNAYWQKHEMHPPPGIPPITTRHPPFYQPGPRTHYTHTYTRALTYDTTHTRVHSPMHSVSAEQLRPVHHALRRPDAAPRGNPNLTLTRTHPST